MKNKLTFISILLAFAFLGINTIAFSKDVAPVFDEYVQEGDRGSSEAAFIYLRVANGFNRVGYLTFDLSEFNQATMANLRLTISSYRADLANPQDISIFATGSSQIPDYSFSTQPANAEMDSLGSVTIDDTSTELVFDLLSAIQREMNKGSRYLVVKLISPTTNAFVQFHSLEATAGPAPRIETDGIGEVRLTASASGFVQQNQNTFNTSLIYIRKSGGFNRVGYAAFPMTLRTSVLGAKLRLSIIQVSRADPATVYITGFTGNQTAGLTYDTQPDGGMLIDSVELTGSDMLLEVDITDFVNSAIADTDVNALTFQLTSPTNDALVQFYSNDGAGPGQEPTLAVVTTCIPTFSEVQEVVCSGDTLFTTTNTITETGVYFDSLLTACGADSITRFNVFFINDETVTIDTAICEGTTLEVFNGVEMVSYSEGGTFMDSTSADGCTFKVITNISILPSPIADLGSDTTISDMGSIELDPGSGFSSYNWSTGAMTPTITVGLGGGFALGTNTVSVTITNENGCEGTDEIVVSIKDDALQPFKDAAMREDQNGIFKTGQTIDLKNDLFGDLNTPAGEGPFFNRQTYFGYDITGFEPDMVTSAKFRLRVTRFSPLPQNSGVVDQLQIPITLSYVPTLYDDNLTYDQRFQGQDLIPIVRNQVITSADLNNFIEFEMTDFMNSEILALGVDEFTLVLTADADTSSTLISFASVSNEVDSLRPRIVWEAMSTGVTTIIQDDATLIFPNPAKDRLFIRSDKTFTRYNIMNMTGQLVKREALQNNEIPIFDLVPGMYVLTVQSEQGIFSKKFVKQE